MQLLPRLCMATDNAAAADGDAKTNGDSNGNKLATAVSSSSSSTVSTSSSAAAAAAVSEASSSSTSLPSLPSLSAATSATLAASVVHVTTLRPLPAASVSSAAAAVVAAADSAHHGLVVARPASVALHDMSTLEATSTSDSADAAVGAGSVKCAAHLHGGGGTATVTGHQDGRLRLWRASSRAPAQLRLAAVLPTFSDRLRRFPVPSNHVAVRRHHRRLWIEHADTVSGVAASADGRLLFSVSWDKTLKVWALPSLRCLQSLPAHDDAVNAVAVAPDGTVYTGSADRRVRVWAPRPPASSDKTSARRRAAAAAHGKKPVYHLVATLSRHTAAVNAVAVGCGGQALYSGGNDRSVVVWEREDSASHMVAIGELRGHRQAVLSIACAGGGLVVSGSADQTVRAWRRAPDGRGYVCVAVIDGHGTAVRSIAAAPVAAQKQRRGGCDEEWRVCSASFDGEVRVWSLSVSGL